MPQQTLAPHTCRQTQPILQAQNTNAFPIHPSQPFSPIQPIGHLRPGLFIHLETLVCNFCPIACPLIRTVLDPRTHPWSQQLGCVLLKERHGQQVSPLPSSAAPSFTYTPIPTPGSVPSLPQAPDPQSLRCSRNRI